MSGSWLGADWPAPDDIVAGCSYRYGGVSRDRYVSFNLAGHVGDDPVAVRENRGRLAGLLELPAEPGWLRQVHGTTVVVDPPTDQAPEGDASVTTHPGVVCAVLTADCLPVLLAASDGSEVAAAHAGWRGLSSGILEATVGTMSSAPETLLAWLGPAISQAAFEVGPEVRDAFLQHDADAEACFAGNARGRWQADLYALARLRLGGAGVTSVFGDGRCTYGEEEQFFSYRRDGRCGRMASLIFRRLK